MRTLSTTTAEDIEINLRRRDRILKLITSKQQLGAVADEMADFLRTVTDPDTFADLAASTLCESPLLKQQLLETLDVGARLELFSRRLRAEVAALRLQRRLQGGLDDKRIETN